MKLTWRYLADLLERTVRTFIQAYLGYWVTLGGAEYDTLFTINNLKVAVAAAALSIATAVVGKGIGNPDSASVLPPQAQPPAPQPPEPVPEMRPATRAAPPLPVQPPIVAAIYSARLGRWTTMYLRPAPVGGGQFVLTPTAHNGLPVAERRPGGPLTTIGPEEQSRMGLRDAVSHPDEGGD